jgi:hypothetical protein
MTPQEEWRACTDFPGYEVSSIGGVRRVAVRKHGKPPGVLKTWCNDGAKLRVVMLRRGGKSVKVYVHRLVGEAFKEMTNEAAE